MNRFHKKVTSPLFWINFLYLQWFFVRLAFYYRLDEKNSDERGEFLGWSFIGFMLPLAGWWTKKIWIWKFKSRILFQKN